MATDTVSRDRIIEILYRKIHDDLSMIAVLSKQQDDYEALTRAVAFGEKIEDPNGMWKAEWNGETMGKPGSSVPKGTGSGGLTHASYTKTLWPVVKDSFDKQYKAEFKNLFAERVPFDKNLEK